MLPANARFLTFFGVLIDMRSFSLGESMARPNPSTCPLPILGSFLALWLLGGCGSSTTSSLAGSPNPAPTPSSIDVTTYHYDNMRTGQNTHETSLTTANVNSAKFGKLGAFIVDGKVDAQPLYLSNVSIPGRGMRNVLYVATEHGSVFAFDADSVSGNTTTPLEDKLRGCNSGLERP